MQDFRQQFDRNITSQNELLNKAITDLTKSTDNRLKEISGQVEKRLNEGFDKTTKTFNDVLKRLALIDDAQKKITELSTNVVSLQEILNDKRSRGAFGEVQLQSLVANIMPETHFTMQKTLSNHKIADCLLLMPEPTGNIAIDAKFPLESYKKMNDVELAQADRAKASKQFIQDIKTHIKAISEKYILPPETSDGAVMFIPAESIFAEIHGHHPELVEYAYQAKVWMVSPTTLMAILTTASAVIKDEKTRKQVHIIQEHLGALGKDFVRFQSRMEKLSKHIGQVSNDVNDVNISARKISTRFTKIENVDLSLEDLQENSLQENKLEALTPSFTPLQEE
jgi:DNA recombination protein RmuC